MTGRASWRARSPHDPDRGKRDLGDGRAGGPADHGRHAVQWAADCVRLDQRPHARDDRVEILTGPEGELLKSDDVHASGRERLAEIGAQLPLMLRRHRLTKASVLTIYSAIAVL